MVARKKNSHPFVEAPKDTIDRLGEEKLRELCRDATIGPLLAGLDIGAGGVLLADSKRSLGYGFCQAHDVPLDFLAWLPMDELLRVTHVDDFLDANARSAFETERPDAGGVRLVVIGDSVSFGYMPDAIDGGETVLKWKSRIRPEDIANATLAQEVLIQLDDEINEVGMQLVSASCAHTHVVCVVRHEGTTLKPKAAPYRLVIDSFSRMLTGLEKMLQDPPPSGCFYVFYSVDGEFGVTLFMPNDVILSHGESVWLTPV